MKQKVTLNHHQRESREGPNYSQRNEARQSGVARRVTLFFHFFPNFFISSQRIRDVPQDAEKENFILSRSLVQGKLHRRYLLEGLVK